MPFFQSKKEQKVLVSTVVFAIAGFLGIDIHLASLPAIMQFMHTDKVHMQQSISLYLLGMGVSMLFYGPLSDKHGRRPVILFGLILGSLASFVCMFAYTIHQFLVLRLLQGLGCGVCLGLGRTVLGDVLQGERFAIVGSRLGSAGALVPLFAPAVGGYLQHLVGWQANFFALGCYILIAAIIYGIFCPETHEHKNPHAFKLRILFGHYGEILSHRVFVITAILSGVGASITMIYATLSPFIFQVGFHLSPVVYGWIISALSISSLISRFLVSPMIRKFGRPRHLEHCVFAFLLTSLLFTVFDFTGMLVLISFIALSAMSIFCRTAVASVFSSYAMDVFPSKRGVSGSLYGSSRMLISFAISGVVGLFSSDGLVVLVISYLVIACALLIFTKMLIKNL